MMIILLTNKVGGYCDDDIDTRQGRRLSIIMIVVIMTVMISHDIDCVPFIRSYMYIFYHQYAPMSISRYRMIA